MSNTVWSVIKYKPKDGWEAQFLEAVGRLEEMKKDILDRKSNWISLESGEIVQISSHTSLDVMMDGQMTGLTWLDSVDHLLEKYDGDSRTQAFSGFQMDI